MKITDTTMRPGLFGSRPVPFLALPPLALLALLALTPTPSFAADWPQYRGIHQDGRSAETDLLTSWPDSGPREIWRFELGDGYSGMAVAGGRVFTLFGSSGDELAIALDAATGKELWRMRLDSNRSDDQGSGPRSTPVADGELVYALGARGKLFALSASSGEVAWKLDLVSEFGARVPRWGVSVSPLVEGDLLLLDVGGKPGYSLVALDKKTGEVRWHSETDKPGYSTPVGVTVDGVRQILFFTGSSLVSVSPEDGSVYWRHPWKTSYDVNAAMPVFVSPDKVFISTSYDKGATLLQMKVADGDVQIDEIWRDRVMKNHFNSSVLVGDHLYGFDDGTLKCIEAATGEEIWAKRGFSKGSLLYADGGLIVLGERGQLASVEATPAGYRERASFQLFKTRTWTMPSLSEGRLFVRDQGNLVALALN
jgi:outer membrane protein assembly factor BamB